MKYTLILHKDKDSFTLRADIPDLLNNRYNTVDFGKLWFVDFTYLGNFWLFIILEVSIKRLIMYSLKESKGIKKKCSFTLEECVIAISNALIEYDPPEIIHGDSFFLFFTKKYQNYLKKHGIKHSMVDISKHGLVNKVIERFLGTFKTSLKSKNPMYELLTCCNKMHDLLASVIKMYNAKAHKGLLD
jgi:hypothetical protein